MGLVAVEFQLELVPQERSDLLFDVLGEPFGADNADGHVVRVAQEFHAGVGRVVVVVGWCVADVLIERAEFRLERRAAPRLCFSLFQEALTSLQQGTVGWVERATASLTVLLTERRQLAVEFRQVNIG